MVGGSEPVVDVTNSWDATGELEVDGVLGPCTAMAVQRSINAGAWS